MPSYTQSGSLNDKSYNLDAVMKPIGPTFDVRKLRADTPLELELAGTVSATAVNSANGIKLEVRVNGQNPNHRIEGSLKAGHLNDSIYTKSVYTHLAVGSYKCQVYAQAAPGGTATGVILDPGGWGEAILATEFWSLVPAAHGPVIMSGSGQISDDLRRAWNYFEIY